MYIVQESFESIKRASELIGFGERTHNTTIGNHNPTLHVGFGKRASSSEGTQGVDVMTRSGYMLNNCPTPLLPPS